MGTFKRLVIVCAAIGALMFANLFVSVVAGASTPHPKYINQLHREIPSTKRYTNKSMVTIGEDVCGILRGGGSVLSVAETMVNASANGSPFTDRQDGIILGVAVKNLCSSYVPQVLQFIQEYGTTTTTGLA